MLKEESCLFHSKIEDIKQKAKEQLYIYLDSIKIDNKNNINKKYFNTFDEKKLVDIITYINTKLDLNFPDNNDIDYMFKLYGDSNKDYLTIEQLLDVIETLFISKYLETEEGKSVINSLIK